MKKNFRLIILLFLVSAFAFSLKAQTALSEQQRYRLAADYSAQNNGSAVVVMKGDKIVFEDYENGFTAGIPHFLASGTKSFSGVMAIAAQEDGLLNLDEPVSETITEWKTDARRTITIRQLLTLTSGIDVGQNLLPPSFADSIKYEIKHQPGETFEYGPVPFQVFGELMRRKLAARGGETVRGYLDRRILNPIGMKIAFWRKIDGQLDLPGGAFATAAEWAKFGLFLKNGGSWNGKQIVAKKLLDECFVGTKANPAYGISFWLNHKGISPSGNEVGLRDIVEVNNVPTQFAKDLFWAAGLGNQRLYVIRSLDLVIVRQGNFGAFDDGEFLGRIILGVKKIKND
ncbi:MAG: serine hydrolase domain-containing protein [Pyrinomonadaceae bacterium]